MKYDDQDIHQLMQKLKNDPAYTRGFDVKASWKLVSAKCGLEEQTSDTPYGARDYLEYYVWQFSQLVFKPLLASFTVFTLLIAGWVGASNVSSNALPGDQFYSLKLSLEKAQMLFAGSPEQKAKLQVEFTSHRLEEMVELAAGSFEQDQDAILLAVRQFKKEVLTIKEDLTIETKTSTQTELAKEIGRKSTLYKTTVTNTGTHASEQIKEEVDEVKTLLEETEDEAVEVMMSAHETEADQATMFELEKAFEKELETVHALKLSEQAQEMIEQAVVLKQQGEFRRAFQLLKEIQLLDQTN